MATRTVLAVDLGAESGRVVAVHFDGKRLQAEEAHRFPNIGVEVRGTLHWDILRLWYEIQAGIRKVAHADSIGVDTWGVDFGLLDKAGRLLNNPVHYRDRRYEGMTDWVYARVSRREVFERTGIQMMPINTLYQLASLIKSEDPSLDNAAHLIMMSDLVYYFLTGARVNEFTNATTTQLYDPRAQTWAWDMLEKLNIPSRLFGEITHPGVILGKYEGNLPVVLVAQHDTASAVVAVPTRTPNYAYLSSGTWSLLGVESPVPVINDRALAADLTNEGGYEGKFRILKNIMGLWLIQESRRCWQAQGQEYSYDQLATMAGDAAPFVSLIDPDDTVFIAPGDMPDRIRQFCTKTGQPAPESVGAVARCILESLALKYRYILALETELTGQPVEALHIVGGGSQNKLLCQMAANATGRTVISGPSEATALGNAVVQLIALGELKSMTEGRALIRESFPVEVYEPRDTTSWVAVEARFKKLVEHT